VCDGGCDCSDCSDECGKLLSQKQLPMLITAFHSVLEIPISSTARASAMHYFVAKLISIAVMTYSYVYHSETYVR